MAQRMSEYQLARAWREKHKFTVDELADLIGYARETIYQMERGGILNSKGVFTEVNPWVFQRYRRACEGLERELSTGKKFQW